MTSAQIRQAFLDFFAQKGHQIVPSAPVVVKNDPTLMFTNAGMNQFKDYFLGNKTAPSPRIADTQKCLRVSGKHNDLEEVGVDTYHHTLFEMLGNWSFGNYFKKEAIEWSWELLTKVLGIPEDRMYVTVFEGDSAEGLPMDDEAAAEWRKWVAPGRILLGNKKDNFWEMGDTGPCGPCTEIHVDTRPDAERAGIDGKTLVNADHPQVIEIWNNVFIQYNRTKDGSLQPLPARHVDTGMGFERLVRVLQGKQSNYDTDVFTGTISAIEKITGNKYEGSDAGKSDIAFRVLSDHIRAVSFTIADGQLPANGGAGYVIRRILRRAVRYYFSYLEYKQPLLHQLVPVIAEQFRTVFPELDAQQAFVARVIREEEESFLRTLDKGLRRIDDLLARGRISGAEAFELNDTYGFPFDLSQLIASERGLSIDEAEFNAERKKQQERGREDRAVDASDWITVNESANNSLFVGYDSLETTANILRYRHVKAKGKESYQLVLDRTPFYAESGGQVGDTGLLLMGDQRIRILDTRKENDLIVHFAERLPEQIGGEWTAKVDGTRRTHTAVHHSATHLLHAALRLVLGTHVAQKGSLVNAEYLRFDFSHFAKMTDEEIARVEHLVNEKIRENVPVVIQQMPKEEAMKSGATALFGEKYGDTVRVVTIDPAYSVELCGGTHVGHTGELGYFKITSESSSQAGVRRVEAVCGLAAELYLNEQLRQLREIREALQPAKEPLKGIASLKEENTALGKQVEKFQQAQINALRDSLLQKQESVDGLTFIGAVVSVGSADALKKLVFDLKGALNNAAVVLAANIEGKASVAIAFDEALVSSNGYDAGALIKGTVAPLIKGGGGGQKSLATAGGQDAGNLQAVIDAVKAKL
ncbi:alanine--tRNA ligase [Flaviaesturariibacter aridisoli]|uniref:Alanine--tRNA ligase n=2 Tax=Flaviaesturariibacter aridisoli TaxID=2545761 RepID=A0A4R4E0Q5_9BACT|nr:alanine--tRNA ligase [Flaviaesturariibacter aridisoli]